MKVAIYSRVSTDKQDPINQTEALLAFVTKKPEWELYKIYEDKESGATGARTHLDELMQDARKGLFEHVVFWKVSRLARSQLVYYQILDEWKKLGITYSIQTIDVDTSTPWGKCIVGIMEQLAELERENIREQSKLALERIKKELREHGQHIKKDGSIIKKLGRPKGSKDRNQRSSFNYIKRWSNKGERIKQRNKLKINNSPLPTITKSD